jgi:chemotaxis protein MotA
MDIATVIGLILGTILVLGSIMISGDGLAPFIDIPSVMITVGGSFAALLINFPLRKVLGVTKVLKNCFFARLPNPESMIGRFRDFATIVRKDGLLALEPQLETISDPFLRRGLELVVAGNSRDDISSMLQTELACIELRHQSGKKILESMAAAAPAFGMIGTLVGLVQMLRTLDDPSKIGGGMATALLTTLYGALIANLFCIPLAGKLEARSQEEINIRELMIAGLASLVDGTTPRGVEERLMAFVAPETRRMSSRAAA